MWEPSNKCYLGVSNFIVSLVAYNQLTILTLQVPTYKFMWNHWGFQIVFRMDKLVSPCMVGYRDD